MPGVSRPSASAHEQPVPEVVEKLQKLLAEAQQGRVRAVAFATVGPDHVVAQNFEMGSGGYVHDLMAGISYLAARYAAAVNRRDDPAGPLAS
jgi:hypothetical protein